MEWCSCNCRTGIVLNVCHPYSHHILNQLRGFELDDRLKVYNMTGKHSLQQAYWISQYLPTLEILECAECEKDTTKRAPYFTACSYILFFVTSALKSQKSLGGYSSVCLSSSYTKLGRVLFPCKVYMCGKVLIIKFVP